MPDFDIDFCMDGRDRVIEYVVAEIRQRARLADHHLRHHGREGRGARRAAACSAWATATSTRSPSSFPSSSASRSTTRSRRSPSSSALYKEDEESQEPHRPRALARRPDAQRRHARRRRGDRALEADRVRAAVRRRQGRQRRHAVRQGRRRSRRPGEVRLPRPAHADGHRPGGEDHQRAPRARAGEALLDISPLPMDDKATYDLMAQAKTTAVFQLESRGMKDLHPAPEARPVRGHRRAGGAVPSGPARIRHGRRLHRPQAQPQRPARAAHRLSASVAAAGARADLRRHPVPGTGDADRAGARRLLARRRRPAAPRDGQEEARGDGEGARQVRRAAR